MTAQPARPARTLYTPEILGAATMLAHLEATENDGAAVFLQRQPEAVAGEVAERQLRVVLVVVFADEIEACGEAVAQRLAPRDAVRSGEALVDEIKGGEEEQRFVGPLVALPPDADDTDVEGVETVDGGFQQHAIRKAE